MSVPKLYRRFYSRKVFSFSDILDEFGRENKQSTLHAMVHACVNSGYIGYIKKGLYYLIPEENRDKDYVVDRFLVASKLTKSGVIAYHSALEMHGVANSLFNTVYVLAPKRFKRFEFQGTSYASITSINEFGTTEMRREGVSVRVTDRERTFLDCLDRLKYSGGLEEFLKSVQAFPSVDTMKIIKYLHFYDKKALYSKTGYVLELLHKRWHSTEKCRQEIASRKAKKIYYLERSSKRGRLNSKWNLIVPRNIEALL